MPKVGDHVIFVDPVSKKRDALVTAVWGPEDGTPAINIVLVHTDEKREDGYGRQMDRITSVVHESSQSAHGNFWREA